jgi:hypothetical protein
MPKLLITAARRFVLAAALLVAGASDWSAYAQTDPLSSWNEGAAKKVIVDFVTRVTREGGPDFVAVPERIATFDNDGTLWTEQPYYFQLAFALDRVKAMAPQHPEWKSKQPFKPVGINHFIGRRPIFALGNSDGDLQMLQWTMAGKGLRFAGLVHHTDAEREYAYVRESKVSKLEETWDEAKAKGWIVVDMKQDWKTVFPEKH